jgi:hypothetical protein
LIALFEPSDRFHVDAQRFLERIGGPLITNFVVVGEVAAMLEIAQSRREFLEWVIRAVVVDEQTSKDLPRIVEILQKYQDLPSDLADASLLAMCERRGIADVATLDKDFDVYRTRSRKRLENVFFGS